MLITVSALPRSGTAFVSMLLSLHPDCVGYHELAAYDSDWRNTIRKNKITADCNTYGYLPDYDAEPDKRIYIINTITDSHRSAEMACRKVISHELMLRLEDAGTTWAVFNDCYVIDRSQVFTESGSEGMWRYCFPDTPPPMEKIRQLIKLNIQHHNAHILFGQGKEFKL
jgi:hypothetical protein